MPVVAGRLDSIKIKKTSKFIRENYQIFFELQSNQSVQFRRYPWLVNCANELTVPFRLFQGVAEKNHGNNFANFISIW